MMNHELREAIFEYGQTAHTEGYWFGNAGTVNCQKCQTVQYADADASASGKAYGHRRCTFHSLHRAHAEAAHRAAAAALAAIVGAANVHTFL